MSNTCPKCGRTTDDPYVFCGYCGAPLDTASADDGGSKMTAQGFPRFPENDAYAYADPPAAGTAVPAAPKKKSKFVLWISLGAVVVIAAVAVAVVLIFLNGGNQLESPQAVLDRMIDTALSGAYDETLDCIYEYHYSAKNKQEALETMNALTDDLPDGLELDREALGSLFRLKVNDTDTASPHDEEAIRNTLKDAGIPTDPIEKIVRAEVSLSLMGESEDTDLFFIKAGGGWYLLASGNEEIPFENILSDQRDE